MEHHRSDVEQARADSTKAFSRAGLGLGLAASLALCIAALTSLALASTLRKMEGRAERLRRERDRFFEMSIDMICVAGTDGYFKQLNPAFESILGYSRSELLGKPFMDFVHPDDRAATMNEVKNLARGETTIGFENRYRCKDETYKWLSWDASPEATGNIYAVARDVTERRATQEKLASLNEELRVMAGVDELTGLHNRRGFNLLADQELKLAHRQERKALFFFADLDGLKRINDEHGHDVGDTAIRDAGHLLRAAFRKSDIVARLGGDEFVVLVTDTATDTDEALIRRVHEMVSEYNSQCPARSFKLAVSIGSTIHDPRTSETIDVILKRADEMMYAQKARHRADEARSDPPKFQESSGTAMRSR